MGKQEITFLGVRKGVLCHACQSRGKVARLGVADIQHDVFRLSICERCLESFLTAVKAKMTRVEKVLSIILGEGIH